MNRYSNRYKPRSVKKLESKAKTRLIVNIVLVVIGLYIVFMYGFPFFIGFLSKFSHSSNPKVVAEDDSAIAPPVLNIPYEATNTATIKVSGYGSPSSKVEVYFDDDLKATVDTDSDGSFQTDDLALALGTNNIYGKTVDSAGKKSLSSKNITLLYNNEKPKLDISSPSDGQQIKGGDKKVNVSGKTDTSNSVTVNGSTVILGGDGTFSTDVSINDGDNTISVSATDQFTNTTTIERKVNYSGS